MYILEELWAGNVHPGERRYRPNAEYAKHLQKMEQCEDIVRAELSANGKEKLNEFLRANMDCQAVEACDNFICGFRLGALLMMDVLRMDGEDAVV